nr:uncharacterized LOC729966 homolog [Anolis sagrei ordinatus]
MLVSSPVAPMTGTTASGLNDTTWLETSPSPKPPETTDGNGTTSHGTTRLEASTTPTKSKEPLTSPKNDTSAGNTTATDGPSRDEEDDSRLSEKPGLVAVICIFLSVLLIGAIVVVVKCFRARGPAFQKLDEVPMQGKASEDSPFARYPPK